jgi:MFS transporter, DHA1 family, multidrug resistance protein
VFAVAATALAFRYIPETRAPPDASAESALAAARAMLAGYFALLATPRFLAYALIAAGAHAGFHIFAAGAPAVLIGRFGVRPEEFGYYASLPPIGFLVGSFVSNRLTRRLGIDAMIRVGILVLVPAGLAMLALALFRATNPYAVVGPMVFVCCGSGLITPNAIAGSLGVDQRVVGSASGQASFLQMIAAAGATAALSLGAGGSPLVLAGVVAFAGLFGTTAFASLMRLSPRSIGADPVLAD